MIDDSMLQKDKLDESLANIETCKEVASAFTYMLTQNDYGGFEAIVTLDSRCLPIATLVSNSFKCNNVISIYPVHFSFSEYKLRWGNFCCLNKVKEGIILISDIVNDYDKLQKIISPLDHFRKKGNFGILCLLCIKFEIDKDIGIPVLSIMEKRD